MLHCEEYDDSGEPIPIQNISKPQTEDEILNIRVHVMISAESMDARIFLSPDKTVTESTVSYEIALGTKTNNACEIRLRNQTEFTTLYVQPCVTIFPNITINIIAKSNGIISVNDGPQTYIAKADASEILPVKAIKYVLFSPLRKTNNRFFYNCYEKLEECNTYIPTHSPQKRSHLQYFPIEQVSRSEFEHIIVNISFTVWTKSGDAYVSLTSARVGNHPKLELKIMYDWKGDCSLQIEKRHNYDKEILLTRECFGALSIYEPVEVTVTIYESQNINIAFTRKNRNTILVVGVLRTELIPIKYISFSNRLHFTKYFFACPI